MASSAPPRHRFWRWFYDRSAFAYDAILLLADRLRLGSEGPIRSQILAGASLPARSRVLDLGCGTAASRPYLPGDILYVGMDISRGMLRRAKINCAARGQAAHFVQADARALPFVVYSMDLILVMGVLQHVDDPGLAIRETRRVASPQARLLLIDERRAQARLLQAGQPTNANFQLIGEYFILDLQGQQKGVRLGAMHAC